MAAEGAIAMKKKILYVFSSLNVTIFFFEDCFRIVPLEKWIEKQAEEMWFYITWFNWYFQIKLGNYSIMSDVRLK